MESLHQPRQGESLVSGGSSSVVNEVVETVMFYPWLDPLKNSFKNRFAMRCSQDESRSVRSKAATQTANN